MSSTSVIATRVVAVAGLVLMMLGASGCTSQTGQYAPVKQQWDSPRSDQVEDALRNRLAHTQHDH